MPLSGWLMTSAAGVSVYWFGYLPVPDLLSRDQDLFEALRRTHYLLSRLLIVYDRRAAWNSGISRCRSSSWPLGLP